MELVRTDDSDFLSTVGMFRDFLDSSIWHDLLRELDIWERQQVEILSEEDVLIDLYRAQGRMEVIKNLREMPQNILEYLEAKLDMIDDEEDGYV